MRAAWAAATVALTTLIRLRALHALHALTALAVARLAETLTKRLRLALRHLRERFRFLEHLLGHLKFGECVGEL